MAKKLKTAKQMERHLKGLGNHTRIEILLLLAKEPGLSIDAIAERLGGNYKTVSQHAGYLVRAGLVEKAHDGAAVRNRLTPYGEACAGYLSDFRSI